MLKSFGSFGSRKSLNGNGRRASVSSVASVEGEELQREHEERERHAMSLSVEHALETEEGAKPGAEQQKQHDEHEGDASKGIEGAETEIEKRELGDIVEHAVDDAETDHEHEQPSVVVSEPHLGPEARDTPATEAETADSVDANAHEDDTRRRVQHSLDASVSSTWTAVDDVDVAPAESDAEAKPAPKVLFKLQEDEGVQTEAVQETEDVDVSNKHLIVPSVVVEEIKPYVLDGANLHPDETLASEVEASPPTIASPSQDPRLETSAAIPRETVHQAKGPSPSLPRTSSSSSTELDDHAPELHTPGHIPSLASLFLPSPEVRVFVTECARLSWWLGVAAAPSALLYLFHNRRSLWGRT